MEHRGRPSSESRSRANHSEDSKSTGGSNYTNAVMFRIQEMIEEVVANQKSLRDELQSLKVHMAAALTVQTQQLEELKQQVALLRNDTRRLQGSGHTIAVDDDPAKAAALKEAENLLVRFIPGGQDSLVILVHLAKNSMEALGNLIKTLFDDDELRTHSITGKRGGKEGLDPTRLDALYRYACLKLNLPKDQVNKLLTSRIRYARGKAGDNVSQMLEISHSLEGPDDAQSMYSNSASEEPDTKRPRY